MKIVLFSLVAIVVSLAPHTANAALAVAPVDCACGLEMGADSGYPGSSVVCGTSTRVTCGDMNRAGVQPVNGGCPGQNDSTPGSSGCIKFDATSCPETEGYPVPNQPGRVYCVWNAAAVPPRWEAVQPNNENPEAGPVTKNCSSVSNAGSVNTCFLTKEPVWPVSATDQIVD